MKIKKPIHTATAGTVKEILKGLGISMSFYNQTKKEILEKTKTIPKVPEKKIISSITLCPVCQSKHCYALNKRERRCIDCGSLYDIEVVKAHLIYKKEKFSTGHLETHICKCNHSHKATNCKKIEYRLKKANDLLKIYKKRIAKDYIDEIDKGLVITYLEEFVKDLGGK